LAQRGFTLLEIMIALAIIAVAFVALLGLRNSDIVMHERARAVIQATALAQQRLGDTVVGPFPDIGSTEGSFEEEDARYTWRQDVAPTPFDFAREVRVSVTWGSAEHERVDLVRYVFDKSTAGGRR
jgi:general secretion pathway protein I